MHSPNRRRSIILLTAVLLPSTALVGIAVRLIKQERELAMRRAVQARRSATLQLGQQLQRRLDAIRPGVRSDSSVILAMPVTNGSFILPWESTTAPALQPQLDSLLKAAAAAEYRKQFDLAASMYRRAQTVALKYPVQRMVTLARARNAAHAGDDRLAGQLFAELLTLPLTERDEEGMPFAVYAADYLKRPIPRQPLPPLSPIALYAVREHQQGSDSLRTEQQIRRAQQLEALRRDYSALLTNNVQQGGHVWQRYGIEPWLVRADSNTVIAVNAADLINAYGATLRSSATDGAEPLGETFPRVYATLPASLLAPEANSHDLLLIVVLLTIGIAALTAYLAWRDVQREVSAAQMRTHFVSSVSHELKTPLTAIRMYSELLRMGVDLEPERRAEYLDTIVNESERLTRLINNVLDFSRIERGERTYHKEPVSLQLIAEDVERSMSQPLAQAGFRLAVSIDPELPLVNADRDALSQAVLNLVSNAVKFSQSARDIELNVLRRNGHAVIEVKDRGRGISASVRPHIFDRFYRAPDVEADGIPGTGLGLSLVAHVARGHGGAVTVESEPGRGSSFSISLPLEDA